MRHSQYDGYQSRQTTWCIFAMALTVSKILTFQIRSRSQSTTLPMVPIGWSISTVIKIIYEHFSPALNVFKIFTFQNSLPWNCRLRSRCTAFAVAPFDGKCLTSYLMAIVMFASSSLVKLAILKVWPWKCRQMPRSTILAMVPFDGEYQPLRVIRYFSFFR